MLIQCIQVSYTKPIKTVGIRSLIGSVSDRLITFNTVTFPSINTAQRSLKGQHGGILGIILLLII